jgi:hypothetical protein
MTETQIQSSIIKYLKQKYPKALVFKHSDKTRCGIPDIQFIHMGTTLWFEVKKKGGRVSDIQQWTLGKLKYNHIRGYVVYSLDEVKEIV